MAITRFRLTMNRRNTFCAKKEMRWQRIGKERFSLRFLFYYRRLSKNGFLTSCLLREAPRRRRPLPFCLNWPTGKSCYSFVFVSFSDKLFWGFQGWSAVFRQDTSPGEQYKSWLIVLCFTKLEPERYFRPVAWRLNQRTQLERICSQFCTF